MHRFPLVQDLDGLNPVDFQDPEARVKPEDVVGRIETGDSLSELLMSQAEAGRPIVLKVLAVRRLDGVFIVAGALAPVPVDPVHVADTSAPVVTSDAEFIPIAPEEKSPAGDAEQGPK